MNCSWRCRVRLLFLLILLLVLTIDGGWWWLPWRPSVAAGRLNQGHNGLWLSRYWLHGGAVLDHSGLVDFLKKRQIDRIYPFLGPMNDLGHPGWRKQGMIRTYDRQRVRAFFQRMRAESDDLLILPWTGGVLGQDVRFQDRTQQRAFIGHVRTLMEMGADGIHINIEPLPSGHAGFLDFLTTLKESMGRDGLLSVAAYPPPTWLHENPQVHWQPAYVEKICRLVDELVFMGYDTGAWLPVIYRNQVFKWTRDVKRTLDPLAAGACRWFMGMPAYDDEDTSWHRPWAETLEQGLSGLSQALHGQQMPAAFQGITLYAAWTASRENWRLYDRAWIGQSSSTVGMAAKTVFFEK